MSKAYVDTTILVDALLKPGARADKALGALRRFAETEIPVYAIKEFKIGALTYYKWWHNKLLTTGSYSSALRALQVVLRQKNRASTGIEALAIAADSIAKQTPASLGSKYGRAATMDQILTDEARLNAKRLVMRAWSQRRKVTSAVVLELSCYRESDPDFDHRGLIQLRNNRCPKDEACCLGPLLRSRPDHLERLKAVADREDEAEHSRRSRALRELIRKPKSRMTDQMCRDLGDAVFAFFAPEGSTILTTNIKDHVPLAGALGKTAEAP